MEGMAPAVVSGADSVPMPRLEQQHAPGAPISQREQQQPPREDLIWTELLGRVTRVVDGEVFRCIELLSLKEQSQVAELVRQLLRQQIERARASRICATSVVENWHRVVGPLDQELLELARGSSEASHSARSVASSCSIAASGGSGGNTRKRRRAEFSIHDQEDDFLKLVEVGDDAGATSMLEQSCEPGRLLGCTSEGGLTALHHASFAGYEMLVRRLLDFRAEVNRKTDYGFTALMAAVQSQNVVLLTTILEHRAEVDACTNFDGRSALHLSAGRGDVELCRILIDASSDPTLKDKRGNTAVDKARENNHDEVVQLLEMAGRSVHDALPRW